MFLFLNFKETYFSITISIFSIETLEQYFFENKKVDVSILGRV